MKFSTFYKVSNLLILLTVFSTSLFATTLTVTLTNFAFTPDNPTVHVGDTILWVEGNGTGHTTTSSVIPSGAATWDSPVNANTSFSYVVTVAGTYHYACTPHEAQGMIAQFIAISPVGIPSPLVNEGPFVSVVNNPVNNQIVLQFNLEKPLLVEISLYDLLGKKAEVLSNEMMKAGEYIKSFNLSQNYRPGIYFLSVNMGEMKQTERIVIE